MRLRIGRGSSGFRITKPRTFLVLSLILASLALVSAFSRSPAAHIFHESLTQSSTVNKACSANKYRQFDFWVGDWDVSDFDKPTVIDAHVRVDLILDGCVLHEDYQDANHSKGESFSIYDTTTNSWHQTWVTNRGRLLLINGNVQGDAMVLSGEDRTPDGKGRLVRGTWRAVPGGVRESAATSMDDGKTWTQWFDLLFRPHK